IIIYFCLFALVPDTEIILTHILIVPPIRNIVGNKIVACIGVNRPSATKDAANAAPPARLKNTVAKQTIAIGGIPKICITGANILEKRSIKPVVSSIYINV